MGFRVSFAMTFDLQEMMWSVVQRLANDCYLQRELASYFIVMGGERRKYRLGEGLGKREGGEGGGRIREEGGGREGGGREGGGRIGEEGGGERGRCRRSGKQGDSSSTHTWLSLSPGGMFCVSMTTPTLLQ
jgi:hypothetical protein